MADATVAVRDANGTVQLVDNVAATNDQGQQVVRQRVTVFNPVATGTTAGPASYATGGFVIDLTATFSSLSFLVVAPTVIGPNLPPCHYEYTLNTPVNGKATVKVMRHRYDRLTTVDNVSGQPAGVTVQGASGATVNTESAHTHAFGGIGVADHAAHTHNASALTAQSVDAVGGVGNATRVSAATGNPSATLTHTVSGSSAAGSAHQHVNNNIYQHQHGVTQTETNAASVELANGTVLSGTTWQYLAVGS